VTKITPEHLNRGAYIYIRQSTADQLLHNHESRRRQYGLADRARQLGWQDVVVIDDDLGRSGSGISRPGLSACWRRFAKDGSAQCLPSRYRDWHVMDVTGIP
jgi:DNA invertase Pin-like site-specific DNA recombinase